MDDMMPNHFVQSTHSTVIFGWLVTDSIWSYSLVCAVLFLLCVWKEWLYDYRTKMQRRERRDKRVWTLKKKSHGYGALTEPPMSPHVVSSSDSKWTLNNPFFRYRIVNSCVYVVSVTLAYLLMLVLMTYNMGYFVALVLGSGIGHFLFRCATEEEEALLNSGSHSGSNLRGSDLEQPLNCCVDP